ncbi:Uncharacterized conserved protein, DUF1697 family [Aquimarina amphilecti]|uniref:Uncharacterized conserved protein, DUF1697 family n=1 Tax=Aquimarina amphilecti TaxID=1038014 RepID=A0A1H7RNP7_AQUAM|nr:DUF1697 domain-containing protein [Aquimarina amphilecti]SEL61679.1 Uncharacterized conserved protein, DUF1697 family [Aquimarina amphilecti]
MNTYIVLLRGINVGGHKKIKMDALKQLFLSLEFTDVETYIQSGNVVVKHRSKDIKSLEAIVRAGIEDCFGFDVPILMITHETLDTLLNNNPFIKRIENNEIESKKMYFMLLYNQADTKSVEELSTISFAPEEFVITQDVIYLFAANGYGKTKLHSNFFEKKLKCVATTRNLKTMNKLLELSFLIK